MHFAFVAAAWLAAPLSVPAGGTPRDVPVSRLGTDVRLLGTLQPLTSREERIAISAYWRAAQREFAPGNELDDWLAAEREVDSEEQSGKSDSR